MKGSKFFPFMGVIVIIVGIVLISAGELNSYLNQPDYSLHDKDISPGDFHLGNVELLENNDVSIFAIYSPENTSINVSISSQNGTVIWEKNIINKDRKNMFSTYTNMDAGNYVVKTTNINDEPIEAFVSIRNLQPEGTYIDGDDAYFIFEIPGRVILGIGAIILIIGLPIFFHNRRKTKEGNS